MLVRKCRWKHDVILFHFYLTMMFLSYLNQLTLYLENAPFNQHNGHRSADGEATLPMIYNTSKFILYVYNIEM